MWACTGYSVKHGPPVQDVDADFAHDAFYHPAGGEVIGFVYNEAPLKKVVKELEEVYKVHICPELITKNKSTLFFPRKEGIVTFQSCLI